MIQHPFTKQLSLPLVDTTLNKQRVLASPYGKSNDYMLLQPFVVAPIVWEGVSLIVKKFLITLPKSVSIVKIPTAPVGVNFCPCVFWRISEGVGARYKLWENVGEILYAPLYTSEQIPPSFILEIWNCKDETDATLAASLQIILSTLSYSVYLCGDGGNEVAASMIEGGDFIYATLDSVDYSLGDYWEQTPLDTVDFINLGDPTASGPQTPDEVTATMYYWFLSDYLLVTSPTISDDDYVGISFPSYTGWVNKPPALPYTSYQASADFRPKFKENILGTQPSVLFDGGDQLPIATSLEPGSSSFTFICICKQVTQAGVLFGGVKLSVVTNASNKIAFGYNDISTGWTFIESDAMTTSDTAVKMVVVKLNFATGSVSFRENKSAKGSGSFTLAAGFESFNNICADSEGTNKFGGHIFEWLLWNGTVSDADIDDLYDNYFKTKWVGLP